MKHVLKRIVIVLSLLVAGCMVLQARTGYNYTKLYAKSNYLIKADGSVNVDIYSVINPGAPELLTTAALAYPVRDVFVQGNYLYAAAEKGVMIYDMSDITNLQLVKHFYLLSAGGAGGIAVKGNYLFVTDFYIGLMIYDISDLTNIVKVKEVPLNGFSGKVVVKDNSVFVAETKFGKINIIDITDIDYAEVTGYVRVRWPGIHDFEVCNNYIFVASSYYYRFYANKVLEVFDRYAYPNPLLIKSFEHQNSSGWQFLGITSDPGRNKVYVGTSVGTVQVVNFSAPGNIYIEDTFSVSGYPYSLAASQEYIYVSPDGQTVVPIRK